MTGWYVPVIILFWGPQQEITGDSQMLTMVLKATWSQTTFVPLVYLIIFSVTPKVHYFHNSMIFTAVTTI